MRSTSKKRRAFRGPVLFSHGFSVLFLSAGLWAALAMALWVGLLSRGWSLPTRFDPVAWHVHEMLFGYSFAVLAGVLLTAVPNWTGRLPVIGWPTAGLAGLWLLGRLAAAGSAGLPLWLADAADLVFPLALVFVLTRAIVAGKNWRNLKVLVAVLVFALADALYLAEALHAAPLDGFGLRLGVAAIIWLISLIGGRVVPSFTRNWLARNGAAALPVPFNRQDMLILWFATLVLALWVVLPAATPVAPLAAVAGLAHLWRLWRWRGWLGRAEPLVWVLHIAYLFVAIGFFELAARGPADFLTVPHGWTAGAVALMTLAMMSRASLGHSGRMLAAGRGLTLIYIAVTLAAIARVLSEYVGNPMPFLDAAGALWILGFGGFSVLFWPILTRAPR